MSREVVHVTRDFPPRNNGGLSTAVGGMVKASIEDGLACRVISFDAWRPRSANAELPVEARVGGARVLRIRGTAGLDEAARWGEAEIVHVHDPLLWSFARTIVSARRVYSVHVAHAALNRLRGLTRETASAAAEAIALGEADVVTIPSPGVAHDLPEGTPHALVPLGLHDPGSSPRRPVAGRVLFVGRFADVKGLDELTSAFRAVRAERPEAELVVAGGLPDSPKIDRRWRRRLAGEGVTLLGWLDAKALAREHARAAIYVLPSWYETFGTSALEAMRAGVPVLGTATPGLSQLICDRETGRLVPPRDPEALREALLEMIARPEAAAAMGARGAVEARTRWTWRMGPLRALYDS